MRSFVFLHTTGMRNIKRQHEGIFLVRSCIAGFGVCSGMDFTGHSMTEDALEKRFMELLDRRIGLAARARNIVTSEWGKLYWDSVIAALLRKANRLH